MRLTQPRVARHPRQQRWLIGAAALASLLIASACAPAQSATSTTPSNNSQTGGGSPSVATGTASGGGSSVPSYQHVFIIVMENQDYDSVIGSSDAPYINGTLARGGTVFANYGNIAHPSEPNYIALLGGDTFGVDNDDDPPSNVQSARNLVDLLEAKGESWKGYMESMPSNAYPHTTDAYAPKHDPFVYFSDITHNAGRANRVVPYTQLARDLASAATTPNFVWITPNLCDDMHDCAVSDGDTWLSQQVPHLLNSPACTQSKCLLAITWDEDEGSGHLPALLYGAGVRAGYTSPAAYNHYALLHTIEKALGLSTLTANDANAPLMTDAFSSQ